MKASNLQELKDAAAELMRFKCNSCERRFCEEDIEEEDGRSAPSPCSAIIRMRNALSANPIRNCDVGTPEEQGERCLAQFNEWRNEWRRKKLITAIMTWAQMPYKAEEGATK